MSAFVKELMRGYEIGEKLGAGGFGVVYRAFQPAVGRDAAIKVIQPEYANQPQFIRHFESEARLVARLEHPHIVPLYDYWRAPDGAYLVMRLLRGNLQQAIAKKEWSPQAAARLLDQIAGALAVAHRDGIIHYDIKPANILLDEDDNAYVADFGIARAIASLDKAVASAHLTTSADYISPEQIHGEPVTARTDVYSLGHVMYELLTGRKAYPHAKTPADVLQQHLSTPIPSLSAQAAYVPTALDEVLQTATAKQPSHRYPSALRLAAAFRAALPNRLPRDTSQPLVDPLTEREMDVLKLVVAGLSNAEIAEQLVLTASTVKWYMKQIYSKLDVHSRQQAVERTHSLRLLNRSLRAGSDSFSAASTPQPTVEDADVAHENPYKGLRAFYETDADVFYGRANLTEQLLSRLSEPGESGRFLVLIGPSGSGKSSAIRAGLIPALRSGALEQSPRPFIADMVPGTHPLEELEAALIRVAANPMPGLLDDLHADRRALVRAAKRLLPHDLETELVLFVDQFEELFTLVEDEDMRRLFIDNLLSAASDPRGRIRVILTLRADFYDRPLLYPRLAEMVRAHTEVIVPLNAREMEQAMIAPSERAGVRWEAGLSATMLHDLAEQPGALPLLQFALTELYERRKGLTLTLDAYRAMGGALGSLSHRADDIYRRLDTDSQKLARELFLRLVSLGEGSEDTRRRVLLTELQSIGGDGQTEDIIDAFTRYRLLTLDNDPLTHTPTVEIAHESLIREWHRLAEWLAESREDIRFQRNLSQWAAEWAGSDDSFLATGTRLTQIQNWAATTTLALSKVERSFLEASVARRARQHLAEKERVEYARRLEKRASRVLKTLVMVLLVATVTALGLTRYAMIQSSLAEENAAAAYESASYARSMALASAAKAAHLSNNPDQAIALAVASVSQENAPAFAESTLYEVAFAPATRRVYDDRPALIVAIAPNGDRALSWDGIDVALWDTSSGEILSTWTADFLDGRHLENVQFAPNGSSAYAVMYDDAFTTGETIEFDVVTGEHLRTFVTDGDHGPPYPVALSPDGATLVAGTAAVTREDETQIHGRLFAWDIDSGNLIRAFDTLPFDEPYDPSSIAFDGNGQHILVADYAGDVLVWDMATGEVLRKLQGPGGAQAVAFPTPSGIVIVSTDHVAFTTTAILIDATTGERRGEMTWATPINNADVSPDGTQLALGFVAPRITILDIPSWQTKYELNGHNFAIVDVAFTSDGQRLLSTSYDGTIRVWNLGHGAETMRMTGSETFLSSFVLVPDRALAIGQAYGHSEEAPLFVWSLVDGSLVRTLGGTQQHFRAIAVSPDGHALVSASTSESQRCPGPGSNVRLTDIATGAVLWEVRKEVGSIDAGITFSQDGRRIFTVDWQCDDVITVWDAETGAVLEQWSGHDAPIWGIAASSDGKWIATASRDSTTILWDASSGSAIRSLDHEQPVLSVAFSADSKRLVTGEESGILRIWDVDTGQEVQQLVGHTTSVLFMAFSPDSRYVLSSGQDSNVYVWDLARGEPIRQFRFPLISPLGSVAAFSADGQSVFLTDDTNAVRQFDLMLAPNTLLDWIRENRYVPELTCQQRQLYQIDPLCEV